MKLLTLVPVLLAWLPEIIKAVTIFELVLDPKTPGAEKKATVMAYLSQVAAKSKLPWGPQAVEVISGIIDTVVNVMNFLKKFGHKDDMPAEEVDAASAAAIPQAEVRTQVVKAAEGDEVLDEFLGKLGQ